MVAPTTAHRADCLGDATRLLQRNGQKCQRVISVDRDSILFVTLNDGARTAWVHRRPGTIKLLIVRGFMADPPADWPPA